MQRKYKWLPEDEYEIKKTFDHKASNLLSEAMYRVRTKKDIGTWIPQPIREQLDQLWNSPEWKAEAKKNSDNRRCSDGPLHTGGSIPTTEHNKKLVSNFN